MTTDMELNLSNIVDFLDATPHDMVYDYSMHICEDGSEFYCSWASSTVAVRCWLYGLPHFEIRVPLMLER